jgi:hypothetical protein
VKRAIFALACGIGLLVLGAPASAGPLQEGFFTLTVQVDGDGTVTSDPSGIDCPDECSADFQGEVVLTAEAAPGWTFVGWEGCSTNTGYRVSAAAETCTVFMDGDQDVTATFEQTSFTLTVHVDGKGTVTSSPGGIDCPKDCSSLFDADTEVALTAKPADGWTFDGWDGCPAGLGYRQSVAAETCTVFMDQSRQVTAHFKEKPPSAPELPSFTLTVTVIGFGSVSSSPAGIDCGLDCTQSYSQGANVTLGPFQNATNFVSWGGDCSGAGLCTVTMTGPRAVTATFAGRTPLPPETQPGGDEPVDNGKTGPPFHLELDFTCYSENEVFLTHLYEDVLKRPVDPAAFGIFGPQLDTGTPPGKVALSVLQSLEYRTLLVRSFYMSFLHRSPSPEELVAGLAGLVRGMSDEQFEASLLGSEEYFQHAGSTQDGFLDALYHDLLGRAPTAGERALFGGMSRTQIAAQVLASNEFRTLLIQSYFQMFLGRAPTPAELAAFLAMFGAGASDEQVAAAILGSTEYFGMDNKYDATIDWGDGSTSPGTVKRVGKRCTVIGTHAYTNPDDFLIEVGVLAPDGSLTKLTHKLRIGGPPTPPPGKENVQVTGIVLIKVNGKFVPLKGFKQVPLGTELDTTNGKVKLTSPDGSTAFFYEGRFLILGGIDTPAPGKSKKVVVIRLTGGNFDACGTRGTAGFSAKPKPKGKPIRHAWGNASGSFRTKGRYASATVRGTLWRTDDYCNGTLITVLRGKVDVLDLVLHKHFLISAGHTYFAPS